MHMFMNTYEHGIDAKGRTVIPSKFRAELGESFVITRGLDGCAFLYPMDEWINFMSRLQALPNNKAKVRDVIRKFTYFSEQLTPDKQGRVVIPQKLRNLCNLNSDIVFAGSGNKVDVWDKELYLAKEEALAPDSSLEEDVEEIEVTF